MSRGNICQPSPPPPPAADTNFSDCDFISGIPLVRTKETEKSEKWLVEMSKKGKKAAGDRRKATILVKVRWLGEKSALGMCERLRTDPAKNAKRVTRAVVTWDQAFFFLLLNHRERAWSQASAVRDLPRDYYILLIFKSHSKIKFSEEPSLISFLQANLTAKFWTTFFLRSLLYTGPVPVYNYSQG